MSRANALELTRLRAQGSQLRAQIATAERRLDASERRSRRQEIEDRLVRLAADVELDVPAEAERLSRLPATAIDGEIDHMRRFFKKRPGLGEPPAEDVVAGDPNGSRIWGEAVARMALEAEEAGNPVLVRRDNQRSNGTRRRDAMKLARAAVRRFQAERSEVSHA